MIAATEAKMTTKPFEIPAARFEEFEARFAKLVKHANKLGVSAPGYEVVGEKVVTIKCEHTDLPKGVRVYKLVNVTGDAPKFAGWTLAGTLNHVEVEGETATIIKGVPGIAIPEKFRTATSKNCDHCHTSRRRIDTHLVVHDDGTWKQVGGNCIINFLGDNAPEDIAAACGYILDAVALGEEFEGGGFGGRFTGFDPSTFYTAVALCIRVNGWCSRKVAQERSCQSTADDAISILAPGNHPDAQAYADKMWAEMTEADKKLAEDAIEWARGLAEQSDLNDYLYNVSVVARMSYVDFKTAGIAASIIPAYQRSIAKELEAKKAADSQYVGTVGKRETFKLTLTFVTSYETMYGVTHVYKFVDENGNVLVWKASKNADLKQGKIYNVKGTVKDHQEYKGVKQTVLSRCSAGEVTE